MDDTLSQKIMDIIGDISPRISTVELEDFAAEAAALEEEIERLRGALEWLANKHLREVGTFATGPERKALVAALVAAALAAQEDAR